MRGAKRAPGAPIAQAKSGATPVTGSGPVGVGALTVIYLGCFRPGLPGVSAWRPARYESSRVVLFVSGCRQMPYSAYRAIMGYQRR